MKSSPLSGFITSVTGVNFSFLIDTTFERGSVAESKPSESLYSPLLTFQAESFSL